MSSTATVRGEHASDRVEGCVLWIYGQAWEDRSELDGLHPPTSFDEWVAFLKRKRWTVGWTPEGALDEGPYQGGAVVEVDVEGDRAYVAIPPELLDRLQEVMPARDYRMTREDVAALDNPTAKGLRVAQLDPTTWEQRRETVPTRELPTEEWARVIRDNGLRVDPPAGAPLALDSAWPAGQVVTVTDIARRYYFAVPRGALHLATDLYVETSRRTMAPASALAVGF